MLKLSFNSTGLVQSIAVAGLLSTGGLCAANASDLQLQTKAPLGYEDRGATLVTVADPRTLEIIRNSNTTLSLYGILDATIASVSNADSKGHNQTGMVVSWMSGNRWGITGSHIIDGMGGLKVIGKLESEFELPTGNMDTPNVLFNRDAWVGVESDWFGKFTIGRQNTLARDFAQSWDPFGTAMVNLTEGGWNNNDNTHQLINYAGGSTGTRGDSSLVWKKQYGNWVFGAAYQFGSVRGVDNIGNPGDFNNGSTQAVAVAYNAGLWNVDGYYTHAIVGDLAHDVAGVGGNVALGQYGRINAGYIHSTASQSVVGKRTDNVWTTSLNIVPVPGGKFDFVVGYYHINANNAGYNAGGNTLQVFSDTSGVTAAGSGTWQTAYVAAFYRFDRYTDVYIMFDHVQLSGGYKLASTHGFNNKDEVGVGLRWKF